jgi:VCBS repeat-containing protein
MSDRRRALWFAASLAFLLAIVPGAAFGAITMTTDAATVTGVVTVASGDEPVIWTIAFTGDGSTAFLALNVSIENLSGGGTIAQSDFQQLTLYRNTVSPTPSRHRVIYVSAQNGNGTGHGNFGFKADDGSATSNEATITVDVTPVDDPLTAVNDAVSMFEDGTLIFDSRSNDLEPDGDPLTVTNLGSAGQGAVEANANGTWTYRPSQNFSGTDRFTYTVSDGNGNESSATVTVTVTEVNDPPAASDDHVETLEDVEVTISVLANDTDVEGSVSIVTFSSPSNGPLALQGAVVRYLPNDGFHGVDTFTYQMKDQSGARDRATVTVTVKRRNGSPVAADDNATAADESIVIAVLDNDSDPDGDSLVVISASGEDGDVSVSPEGELVYIPRDGFSGTDILTYVIDDGFGGSAQGRVFVEVILPNRPPVAHPDTVLSFGIPVLVDLLTNDVDLDGDTWDLVSFAQGDSGGVVAVIDAGRVEYTSPEQPIVSDAFIYVVGDGVGGIDTGRVVVIAVVNDGPVAQPDTVRVSSTRPVDIVVLANDEDPNGDILFVLNLILLYCPMNSLKN